MEKLDHTDLKEAERHALEHERGSKVNILTVLCYIAFVCACLIIAILVALMIVLP